MSGGRDQDRTEQPTSHKLGEAKGKGQVAKSTEFGGVLSFVIFTLFWFSLSDWFIGSIGGVFKSAFYFFGQAGYSQQSLLEWTSSFFSAVLGLVFSLLIIILVISVVFSVAQTGFIWTTHPLKPDLNRLNLVSGFKKLFSLKSLFELFKSTVKLLSVAVLLWLFYHNWLESVLGMRYIRPNDYASEINYLLVKVSLTLGCALLFLSVIDFSFVKWMFKKQMKMSKKEVKDEYKKMEGDPELKNKRKKKQIELSRKISSLAKVREADVVVTNPTHVAVAIKFEPNTMLAPVVVSAGKGVIAAKIRKEARKHGVMLLRSPDLARALYKTTNIGNPIKPEYFPDVAAIYREIYRVENNR